MIVFYEVAQRDVMNLLITIKLENTPRNCNHLLILRN